ncbi:ComF family protein [Sandaracinobacteroides hominis]|uniref:ComF family protein n=1 Tax=Sandaracinobacteroides hominis TaxID=2780086 RepID=UPI001F43B0D0|nr:ComF family protein [Sandaracinobacteroides hominis]
MAATTALVELARRPFNALVDLLMPPACMVCKAEVATPGSLCAECWSALPAIEGARCQQCSIPLPIQWQAESHCLSCIAEPPAFDTAHAPFLYEGPSRQLVLGLKNGKEAWAPHMAAAMLRAAPETPPDAIVVPVPLHRWRLMERGYNQSLLLAREIARQTGATLAIDSLIRVKSTPRTRGMNRRQRERNVSGAFRASGVPTGARILLVDDVITTGATASACARVLKRAGAATVSLLTYARVAATDAKPYPPLSRSQDEHGQG